MMNTRGAPLAPPLPLTTIRIPARRSAARSALRSAVPVYLFMLPALALFLLWWLYPLGTAFVMSFTRWNLIKPSVFVGLDNYQRALHDPVFWQALRNTSEYMVITVAGQLVLGLGAALLLDRQLRFRAVLRVLYYLPVVTSWVVVSLIFVFLFNSQAGVVNFVLRDVLHVIPRNVNWLGDPATALPVVAVLGIWKGVGWTMVIFMAGLQSIPTVLYEAAAIDGASGWRRFVYVTLPLLRNTSLFVLVMLVIGGFQAFISIYVMTEGGPLHSTEVVLTYMYKEAFDSLDLGYGAALSYLLAAIVFVVSLVQIRLLRRQVVY